MPKTEPALPSLHVQISCGNCYGSVVWDECYRCESCGIQWTSNDLFDDSAAEFIDETEAVCDFPSPPDEYPVFDTVRRADCNLPASHILHHTDHHHDYVQKENDA